SGLRGPSRILQGSANCRREVRPSRGDWPVFLPFGVLLAPEDERPQLIASNDIHGAVFVQIRGQYRRAHAGTRVDQLRLKPRSSRCFGIATRLIPVKNRATEWIGI